MISEHASPAECPLRIALIAPLISAIADPQTGGSQVVVSDLARGLAARGHDVTLYAAEGSRVEGVDITSLGIDAAAHAADIYHHGAPATPSHHLVAAYATVYAHVRDQGFDVIHSHGFDPPAITQAVRARIPVLHTLHLPPTKAMLNAISEARASSVATWTFGVSTAHTESWRRLVPMDGILSNGVPVDAIPYSHKTPREALIATRFSPEKGMAEGIKVARQAGWPIVVYGTPYNPAYEEAVRSHWSHDPGVQFRPAVQRASLWDALAAAGAVLCLSRWDEPFGMVAAEAQAAGTPVIATRRGGLAETIRDRQTGLLVETDDFDAAAAALDATRNLERCACRQHAHEHLSLAQSIVRHEAAYAHVVTATRNAP